MNVDRSELLKVLEKVKSSISAKEEISGMNYFLFDKTNITTYNDKISIQHPFKTDFHFFVKATDFYKLISRSSVGEITLTEKDGKLGIKAKTLNVTLPTITDEEISERITNVNKSIKQAKWKTLPDNFIQSIEICSSFASTQESDLSLTCVHTEGINCISSDNNRISHAILNEPVNSMFIKASEIGILTDLEPVEYSVNKAWLHFRNEDKCVFSIREVKGNFPDFQSFFDFEGTEINLPNEIIEGMDIASIFADDAGPVVNVSITKGFIHIAIRSGSGSAKYRAKIDYSGKDITFSINPEFLKQMMEHSSIITVAEKRAKLETEDKKFSLVTALYGE